MVESRQQPDNSDKYTYRLDICYDGGMFHGWQRQPNGRSVQEEIERVLARIFSTQVSILGASRTDSGVSARMQVASFRISKKIDSFKLKRSLNALLPDSILILEVSEVDPRFHPIYDVKSKIYSYSFCLAKDKLPLLKGVLPLRCSKDNFDLCALSQALGYLVGSADFKSFCASDSCVKDFTRTIYEIALVEDLNDPLRYELWFLGSGFLKQMIRSIVGTLFDVAFHKIKPCYIKDILEYRDRTRASATAPATGLVLEYINYSKDYIKDENEDKINSQSLIIQKLPYSKKIITRVMY